MPFDGAGFATIESLQKIEAVIHLIGTPDRWCKGSMRSHDGRYCLRGAIRAAGGGELLEPLVLQAIRDVTGLHYRRIEAFNDHPQTDHHHVCAVLLRTRDNLATGRIATSPTITHGVAAALLIRCWQGAKGWLGAAA